MKQDRLTHILLAVIAVALTAIAISRYINPASAHAESGYGHAFFIEPGVQMLRAPNGGGQVYGKVVVDLRNGEVWGFPTGTTDPYPYNPIDTKPTVSHPMVLGRFAFEDTESK